MTKVIHLFTLQYFNNLSIRHLNANMSEVKPLRVLCLHGYRQDANTFKTKSGGFRKLLKNQLEFVYIDAPHFVPEGFQNTGGDSSNRGWWFSRTDPDAFYSLQKTNICKGFDESVDTIISFCQVNGPFDGLIGFSQGASMVSLLCSLQQAKFSSNLNFRFAILFAGFKSQAIPHEPFYERKISVKSMHVIGENDQIIPKEKSEELAQCFESPYVTHHPGGHFIPSSSNFRKDYLTFLDQV